MNQNDIETIFSNIRKDSSLLNTIDISELLENERNESLENKTLDDILQEIIDVFKECGLENKKIKEFCESLTGYRYIDNLYDIHRGKYIRWINKSSLTKITNGGIVMDTKIMDEGTQILCKTPANRFFQIKFDNNIIFQKLTTGEQLVLYAYEHYKNNN